MSNDLMKREPSIKNRNAMGIAKQMGKRYTLMDAALAGKRIGIDWQKSDFTVGDLLVGMHYELEHGKVDSDTNVTNDNKLKTAKIAWAHLKERPDYYTQLMKIDPPHKLEKKASDVLNDLVMEKQANLGLTMRNLGMKAKMNAQMAGVKMRMIPITLKAKMYQKKKQQEGSKTQDNQETQDNQQTSPNSADMQAIQ